MSFERRLLHVSSPGVEFQRQKAAYFMEDRCRRKNENEAMISPSSLQVREKCIDATSSTMIYATTSMRAPTPALLKTSSVLLRCVTRTTRILLVLNLLPATVQIYGDIHEAISVSRNLIPDRSSLSRDKINRKLKVFSDLSERTESQSPRLE